MLISPANFAAEKTCSRNGVPSALNFFVPIAFHDGILS